MFERTLMVCTGNICRSPMAQLLLADRLRKRPGGRVVESAGIAALVGRPADPMAQELLRARGLDLSKHRGRQLTPQMLRSFDLVLVMELEQQRAIEMMEPSARGRVHRIGRVGGFDVPDPYGREKLDFERALVLIERGLDELTKVFWNE